MTSRRALVLVSGGISELPTGDTLTGAATSISYADNEVPAGTIDGSNDTFTWDHAPDPPESLMLFVNGMLQIQGTHYTQSGADSEFDSAAKPQTGDNVVGFYRY